VAFSGGDDPMKPEAKPPTLRACRPDELDAILAVVNDAAEAYRGVIPADRWKKPYMPAEELRNEIADGVRFWGAETDVSAEAAHASVRAKADRALVGVMGIQDVKDVTLIRHAYVRTAWRRHGLGGALLDHLVRMAVRPVLLGTWADATWAIRFYDKHGFRLITGAEKDRLLNTYWKLHPRHVETSVVMADAAWFARAGGDGASRAGGRRRRRT
jgi:GNAT superfamily N-acetyltransferase